MWRIFLRQSLLKLRRTPTFVLASTIRLWKSVLVNMRFEKEELELKAQTAEKAQIEEEKIKATEDKFQKLKVMYTHIRDEHVTLLRQVYRLETDTLKVKKRFQKNKIYSMVRPANNWCKQLKMQATPSN